MPQSEVCAGGVGLRIMLPGGFSWFFHPTSQAATYTWCWHRGGIREDAGSRGRVYQPIHGQCGERLATGRATGSQPPGTPGGCLADRYTLPARSLDRTSAARSQPRPGGRPRSPALRPSRSLGRTRLLGIPGSAIGQEPPASAKADRRSPQDRWVNRADTRKAGVGSASDFVAITANTGPLPGKCSAVNCHWVRRG